MNAIDGVQSDTWLHRTNVIQHDFGTSWGDAWMHHDGQIEDRTTKIKDDRGHHDVGSCPVFKSNVDASGTSDRH